ncbi:MAG: universal stress protein [Cytophagaceae bacterium]
MNLLVPVDFSDLSLNAAKSAIIAGKYMTGKITFVHVMDYPMVPAMTELNVRENIISQEKESKKEILEGEIRKLYTSLNTRAKEIPYECIIATPPLDLSVETLAKQYKTDIIIMGTNGASGIKKMLLGSNAAKVINSSKIPVLLIPSDYTFTDLSHVALAADIKNFNPGNRTELLTVFSNRFSSDINILYFQKKNVTISEAEIEKIKTHPFIGQHKCTISIQEGEPTKEVFEEWYNKNLPDLIAIMPEEKSFFEGIFTGSTTKELAYHAGLPLLILK